MSEKKGSKKPTKAPVPHKKRGPKWTTIQSKEDALDEILRLESMGFNQKEIAVELGVSRQTINKELKLARIRMLDELTVARSEHVARVLYGLKAARREAYKAWLESHKDKLSTSDKTITRGDSITTEEAKALVKRDPNNAFLQTILSTFEQERKLLGLDEAVKLDVSGTVNIDWNRLITPHVVSPSEDRVDSRLQAIRDGKVQVVNDQEVKVIKSSDLDDPNFVVPESYIVDDTESDEE